MRCPANILKGYARDALVQRTQVADPPTYRCVDEEAREDEGDEAKGGVLSLLPQQ